MLNWKNFPTGGKIPVGYKLHDVDSRFHVKIPKAIEMLNRWSGLENDRSRFDPGHTSACT